MYLQNRTYPSSVPLFKGLEMLTSSETPIIAAVVLVVFGILAWGFYRARPFGKLGS